MYTLDVGGSVWKCDINLNQCASTDGDTIPVPAIVYILTHDVSVSEVPPFQNNHLEDLLKIGTYNGEYILYNYYLLLDDGTVWTWQTWDSGGNAIYIFFISILGGIGGAILGFIAAIIVVVVNVRSSRKSMVKPA